MEQFILVLIIGFITGFTAAIGAGGGLISVPFLMFIGLPPQTAIATNKFGGIGYSIGATIKYWKEGKIVWRFVLPLSVLAFIGAVLGASALVSLDPEIVKKGVGILILILVPFIFLDNEFGLKELRTSRNKKIIGISLIFLLFIIGAFFGGGVAPIIIYILIFFFGLSIIKSNATYTIPWLVLNVTATIIFIYNDLVDYKIGVLLFLSMIIGSYLGAHTSIKKGDRWVKIISSIIISLFAIKIIFFS